MIGACVIKRGEGERGKPVSIAPSTVKGSCASSMFFPAPLAFVILVTQVALSRVHCDVATAQRSPKFKLGGQEAKFFLNFDSAAKDPQINMTTVKG